LAVVCFDVAYRTDWSRAFAALQNVLRLSSRALLRPCSACRGHPRWHGDRPEAMLLIDHHGFRGGTSAEAAAGPGGLHAAPGCHLGGAVPPGPAGAASAARHLDSAAPVMQPSHPAQRVRRMVQTALTASAASVPAGVPGHAGPRVPGRGGPGADRAHQVRAARPARCTARLAAATGPGRSLTRPAFARSPASVGKCVVLLERYLPRCGRSRRPPLARLLQTCQLGCLLLLFIATILCLSSHP